MSDEIKTNNQPVRREVQGSRRKISPKRRDNKKPFERKKEEFQEKVIDMARVTRVMGGGKRFKFRTTIVLGDGKGRVGVGVGKSGDVVSSINKAKNDAKKNLITVAMNKRTIPHEVEAKYSAGKVLLKPARPGNGLVAGGAVRVVLALSGIKDITAKKKGKTSNKLSNARATIKALQMLKAKKVVKINKKSETKEEEK
ncbi:MAG: 30S ribosomal protein S5 [Candidatus Harrisonbacteria bacterium CG10_big_fil_rev_8_21_14_0_10_38_8]|uniref:Small ribosomal subunit protein uS5 n=1 Tax=Candidatus Harrisonbacteria bacterium CG10_big_fil_rev_8_21_14_0_10_38_8 TaxID=1974582 RepID=A0A2M6WK59_9BACT|nr:MAG: 30S ribosomal protein S5 [Candidatus Harrisonbacteria bacterium CG10_big_fil_rev_8_21_14_0_10_38_8]